MTFQSGPIALLITELAYGGTPRSVQRLAEGLWRDGFDVRVASLKAKVDIACELERRGVPVVAFDIESNGTGAAVRALYRYLKRERIGLLHSFNFHANLLGRFVGRAARVPVIVSSERSVESAKPSSRIWCDRLTSWLASRWTVNAAAAGSVIQRREWIAASRITVIPSGVDTDFFAPRARDAAFRARCGAGPADTLLVCVARLDRYKGQDCLIEAFAVLSDQLGSNARLALVGDGRLRGYLESEARRHAVDDQIAFVGSLPDVRPALAAADVFVLASEEEGMPASVLEAMAMGLPIVATAVGGTPELVIDGNTGLLVPPRRPRELAEAIGRVARTPQLAARFRDAARRHVVASFSSERMIGLSETFYRELMGATGLSPMRPATASRRS